MVTSTDDGTIRRLMDVDAKGDEDSIEEEEEAASEEHGR